MDKKFIQLFREILRIFDQELFLQNSSSCCKGISMAQCLTLLEIEKSSVATISQLAKKLSLDKSTVSRTVDGLINIQMLTRGHPGRESPNSPD